MVSLSLESSGKTKRNNLKPLGQEWFDLSPSFLLVRLSTWTLFFFKASWPLKLGRHFIPCQMWLLNEVWQPSPTLLGFHTSRPHSNVVPSSRLSAFLSKPRPPHLWTPEPSFILTLWDLHFINCSYLHMWWCSYKTISSWQAGSLSDRISCLWQQQEIAHGELEILEIKFWLCNGS